MSLSPLLQVRNLQTHFIGDGEPVRAVDGVSFDLSQGETLGIVGESGSGKSVTAMSIMRLLGSSKGQIVGGSIMYEGEDLLAKNDRQMRRIRGGSIAMIFQEPRTAMNPVFCIGDQMSEIIMLHRHLPRNRARGVAKEMLERVHIAEPDRVLSSYPYEMSGGMLQRVMIAMALSMQPKLLIADEPTTALDVTIQAQILRLLRDLQSELGLAVLFITHDLGVVAQLCDRVMVMYAGAPVETAPVVRLFSKPAHPYTRGLLRAVPSARKTVDALRIIPGDVPNLAIPKKGCRFFDRCEMRENRCLDAMPALLPLTDDHEVRCVKAADNSP